MDVDTLTVGSMTVACYQQLGYTITCYIYISLCVMFASHNKYNAARRYEWRHFGRTTGQRAAAKFFTRHNMLDFSVKRTIQFSNLIYFFFFLRVLHLPHTPVQFYGLLCTILLKKGHFISREIVVVLSQTKASQKQLVRKNCTMISIMTILSRA